MSGVDAATCALSGAPMLPPTVTLNPAASSIRPVSAVVVDFPFVPVIAMTRPRSQREASSTSPMTGTPRAARRGDRRLLGRHARAQHDEIGARKRLLPVAAELELDAERLEAAPRRRHRARTSDSVTRAPRLRQQLGGGDAASRRARDRHALPLDRKRRRSVHAPHRSFNVVRLNSAKMIATITKRAMTFGSLQPISSKW